jgi:hypothetical protein
VVAEAEATVAAVSDVVAEAGSGGAAEEPIGAEADEVPHLAEAEQVPVGIPVEEPSDDGDTEEPPPAA